MDVRLFQTADGGELEFVGGQPTMTEGLDAATYLSLFGGNHEDSGLPEDRRQWWGNFDEPDRAAHYRSETQFLLESLPAITGNLRRIEDAALRDVGWIVETGIAQEAACMAGIPALNTIYLRLEFLIDGKVFPVEFTRTWGSHA